MDIAYQYRYVCLKNIPGVLKNILNNRFVWLAVKFLIIMSLANSLQAQDRPIRNITGSFEIIINDTESLPEASEDLFQSNYDSDNPPEEDIDIIPDDFHLPQTTVNLSFDIPDSSFLIPQPRHDTFSAPAANSLLTERALNHRLTQQFIAQYTSPHGIAALNATLDRAQYYMPFIKEEVTRRGLPPELIYLPIIESDFIITAVSRSGAVGLWQFMLNSIGPYNMRVTDYIDERRDFIKSTRGALQKLEDEYRRLGCWELTLAAYNSGLGAITRTIQSTGLSTDEHATSINPTQALSSPSLGKERLMTEASSRSLTTNAPPCETMAA